uniref:Transmembrane protein 176 n=1 Tax=Denticeps clupeoides TaxID=299321 RepID=A0AAY4A879_9TELE
MAVLISGDLAVTVDSDAVAVRLAERQRALRFSVEKCECKALGTSQLMLGLMILANSIPLLLTDYTDVVMSGVPWWSVSVIVISVSVMVSAAAVLTSAIALLVYFADFYNYPVKECVFNDQTNMCDGQHYVMSFSVGVKSALVVFTLIHGTVSTTLACILYRARKHFHMYAVSKEYLQ